MVCRIVSALLKSHRTKQVSKLFFIQIKRLGVGLSEICAHRLTRMSECFQSRDHQTSARLKSLKKEEKNAH